MRAAVSPLSSIVLMSSVAAMSAVSVLWLQRNPDWEESSVSLASRKLQLYSAISSECAEHCPSTCYCCSHFNNTPAPHSYSLSCPPRHLTVTYGRVQPSPFYFQLLDVSSMHTLKQEIEINALGVTLASTCSCIFPVVHAHPSRYTNYLKSDDHLCNRDRGNTNGVITSFPTVYCVMKGQSFHRGLGEAKKAPSEEFK